MAIVINYLYPTPGTTPPTPSVAQNVNTVVATVYPTSGPDTAAVITHNFALPAADISAGWPNVGFEPIDSLAGLNGWWIRSLDPNWVGLARLTSAQGEDTVPQIKVKVARPHTIVR